MKSTGLAELIKSGRHYRRSKGQAVQSFENSALVIMIKSGYIKRYLISNEGTLGVQSIYGPGYLFPLTAVFAGIFNYDIYQGNEKYYYEAITDVEFFALDTAVLVKAAEADPLLYKDILNQTGVRLQSNIQQLENIALKVSGRRVAHQLVFYARHFGVLEPSGTRLLIPLTHQSLGDILSLSRETVSREMVKFRRNKLVAAGKYIVVPDIEKLQAVYTVHLLKTLQ